MKAIIIRTFGGPEVMEIAEVPTPEPQAGEVQIKVTYAGVNPVDWKIREGKLKERLPHEFPIILGWDVAGVISKVGANVSPQRIGEEVFAYARKPIVQWGTYAEYICLDAQYVVRKPKALSLQQAASIPLAGLTAWQSLIEFAKIKPHDKVLIHAGAGGVGSMAIQFAKYCRAHVITTARSANHEYVRSLGADIAIDYTKVNFATKIKELFPQGVDVVFDTLGGKTLEASYPIVKRGGRLVSIAQPLDASLGEKFGIITGYVFVRPDGIHLKTIADLINSSKVSPPKIEEYPLERSAKALETVKEGHTQGKIVLRVA